MENQVFKFKSDPKHRCALSAPGLVITLEKSLKQLVVLCPDGTQTAYPLTLGGNPHPQALFLVKTGSSQMHVGEVDFYGAPRFVYEIPLNDGDYDLAFNAQGIDHIGSLDIRDIGKVIHVFDFSIVPIELSIEGNMLRVTTLEYDTRYELPAWYKKTQL
jgi:hypothetical protein